MIDELVGPPARDVPVPVLNVAGVVGGDTEYRLDQGRLAAPVGADHGDELALVDVHVYAMQDLDRAVAALEVLDFQYPAHSFSSCGSPDAPR